MSEGRPSSNALTHIGTIHSTDLTMNIDCFKAFGTKKTDNRPHFPVGGTFDRGRHFKQSLTTVRTGEKCRNGVWVWSTDAGYTVPMGGTPTVALQQRKFKTVLT